MRHRLRPPFGADDSHAERGGDARNFRTNRAKTENAESLAGERLSDVVNPPPVLLILYPAA